MPGYPQPKDVPGLEHVASALERAERMDAEGPPFELCICDPTGAILAAASVRGFDRVKAFSREMARLGFAARIVGDTHTGCDVAYVRADNVRDIFDDGASGSTRSRGAAHRRRTR